MTTMMEHSPLTTVRDPVCGMEIARSDAVAIRQANGSTYYFCAHDCAVAFDAAPARYTAPTSATTGVPAGGASPARIALPIADLRRSGAPALERAISAVPGVRAAGDALHQVLTAGDDRGIGRAGVGHGDRLVFRRTARRLGDREDPGRDDDGGRQACAHHFTTTRATSTSGAVAVGSGRAW